MSKTIEDLRNILDAHFDVLFVSANASIPKFALPETEKKLGTFQRKMKTELRDLLDRHINADKAKWMSEKSCISFFLEMQKMRIETITALISMGFHVPPFNDDDSEEFSDANAAQFEKIVSHALKPFISADRSRLGRAKT